MTAKSFTGKVYQLNYTSADRISAAISEPHFLKEATENKGVLRISYANPNNATGGTIALRKLRGNNYEGSIKLVGEELFSGNLTMKGHFEKSKLFLCGIWDEQPQHMYIVELVEQV